ncbi:DUF6402 family protein [Klebsiella grimontii]|uniref:DUF6402 family protein n=1 Tax=Klebsiella grimontii TaxID=2058152 RepID=UPI0012B99C41|nr:DUF6402 family protein [Klebsiella grimontii]QMR64730.1 hypothetical protein HV220_05315 [Klebsiella grimontii]WDC45345.1 DUF6402 family protein [Klebsiella grimontii]
MSNVKIRSKLTSENENKQTVPVKIFKITDIPDVMEKKDWTVSARFMRKWFNDPFYEMTSKEKLNKVDMNTVDKRHVIEDLDFDWLLTSSLRIKPIYDNFVRQVSNVIEYNDYLGRKKQISQQLSNGLCYIINRLDESGLFVNNEIKECYLNYGNLSAIELDKISQFNFIKIGSTLWEKATDTLDDVYGALGSFIIKIAFTDLTVTRNTDGFMRLEIKELGLYVRDTYEFMNDGDDQLLGYWGEKGVIKPGVMSELLGKEYLDEDGCRYFRVTNSSFVRYREKYKSENKTEDFFVYSTVKKIPANIIIHLNKIDMEEYIYWKEENVNA